LELLAEYGGLMRKSAEQASKRCYNMQENESGASQSRLETDQGTPKEISSTSGQMKVSQTNIPPSGTRKKIYLLECDEDIITGETNYCRMIPIYDDPIPGPVTRSSENVSEVSTSASRQVTANGGCTQTKCNLSRQLQKRLGQSTSQKADSKEVSK
jgi:hypothetical protein